MKIIVGSALFGLIPIGVKMGETIGVFSLIFGRLLIAAAIIFLITKKRSKLLKLEKREFLVLFCWSLLMLGAMMSYFYAIRLSGVAISAALLGIQPLFITILALTMLKEKMTSLGVLSVMLSLIGIYLITGLSEYNISKNVIGQFLAILSAILLALNFIYQKKYLHKYEGESLVFYQCLFQLPLLLPLVLNEKVTINLSGICAIFLLAVFCTVIAYSLIYNGVRQVAAQKIGVLQSIEYVMPVFIGLLFYRESLSGGTLLGIGLILCSCIMINLPKKKVIEVHSYKAFGDSVENE